MYLLFFSKILEKHKLKIKLLISMLLLSSAICSQQLPNDLLKTEYGSEYFPFNEKMELIFNSNLGETTKRFRIVKDSLKIFNLADKFQYIQTFAKMENGIYLLRTEQKVDVLFLFSSHVNITYSAPALQLPNPLIVGNKWEWKGLQVKNGDTTSIVIKGKVLSEEEIIVPAGKFKTLKIEMFIKDSGGELSTVQQWLAPNIGIVKLHATIEGKGIIQFAMSMLGYDEINYELKEIKYLE